MTREREMEKGEGLEEIDEITHRDERNGVRVVGFKGSSMH